MLHHIFSHPFSGERTDRVLWDLACDIAVENVIAELDEDCVRLDTDLATAGMLKVLKEDVGKLSAESLYRYFRKNPLTPSRVMEYERAFALVSHDLWRPDSSPEIQMTEEEWKKIGVNVVIYANQLMRAEVPAMQQTAEEILKNHRAQEADEHLMGFKQIIRLIPDQI